MGDSKAPVVIRAGTDADVHLCLEVLNRSYGTERFTEEWLDWKHRSCPFGASRMWLAEGPEGIDGAYFALPWRYRLAGRHVDGVRTVDGGTLPPARGRRVLGELIRHEYEQWGPPDRPGVLVATATDDARRSHVRNGALALPALRYAHCLPPLRRPARVDSGDSVMDDYAAVDQRGMSTDWSPEALRWRTDRRSGNSYDASRLRQADQSNGLVYRVTRAGVARVLIPVVVWGSVRDQRLLLSSVSLRTRSSLVMAPSGPGAAPLPVRPVRSSGHAWVCVWDRRVEPDRHSTSPLADLAGWSLSYAELEGLI